MLGFRATHEDHPLTPFATRKTSGTREGRRGERAEPTRGYLRLLRLGRSRDFDVEGFEQGLAAISRRSASRAQTLARLLTQWSGVPLTEREAERAWTEAARIHRSLREALGEPVSLQTALLHLFHTREGLLAEPQVISGEDLENLRYSAITDPLTGLYNRRFLGENLARHLVRAARSEEPVSVAILDLQDFKSINDRFGHRTGDRALIHTAEVIRQSLRPGDTPCRWGGDEFVLVLPQADCLAAVSIAERVRRRIAAAVRLGRSSLSLDLYYGVAASPLDGASAERLLSVADDRLYDCRRQFVFGGANRRRYPRFALDRMRLHMASGGADFVAPVVNVGFGGLAFQSPRGRRSVPPPTQGELVSWHPREEKRAVRIRVTHEDRLPGGGLRVGCKYR